MLACMAAFHRKKVRPETEPLYQQLTPAQQRNTLIVSALIRIADGLDYSQTQTTQIENGDLKFEIEDSSKSPMTNPQSPSVLRVTGPHSDADAARAMKKADLWQELFAPLQIASVAVSPRITPADTLALAGRRILRWQTELIAAGDWRLAAAQVLHPAQVHHLRVTARRMRTTWRIFKPCYKGKAVQPFAKGLRDLSQVLAPVRELDVALLAAQRANTAALQPLIETWSADREAAGAELAAYLRGDLHAAWRDIFDDFTRSDAYDRPATPGEPYYLRHTLDVMLAQHLADVRAYDTLPTPPALPDIHALRIAIKRLRYLSEGLREVLPAERLERITSACAAAQKAYGQLVDAHIVVTRGLAFVSQERLHALDRDVMRGILDFIQSRQQIVQDGLLAWRAPLEPLLAL
jgi:CHAD domain-containing protein